RTRLKQIREKLQSREIIMVQPLVKMESLLTKSGYSMNDNVTAKVESQVEEYIETALPEWLSQAYQDSAKLAFLETLAARLGKTHGDLWLQEFLRATPPSPLARRAVEALSEAIRANTKHDTRESGLMLAQRAAQLFSLIHSRPGVIRATEEQLYSRRLSFQSDE